MMAWPLNTQLIIQVIILYNFHRLAKKKHDLIKNCFARLSLFKIYNYWLNYKTLLRYMSQDFIKAFKTRKGNITQLPYTPMYT
jgi:hypothetical protein